MAERRDDQLVLTGFTVIDGVEPVSERGLVGLQSKVDSNIAWPYFRLMIVVVVMIVIAGVSGAQSIQDTVVFCFVAVATTAVIVLLPALVRRMGQQPEGRAPKEHASLDMVTLSISSDRLMVARCRKTGLDVDDRLRPRLRDDLSILLGTRHGIDIDNPAHAPRIEAVIGPAAWNVIRFDRPPTPAWAGMRHHELDEVLRGCMRAAEPPADETSADETSADETADR